MELQFDKLGCRYLRQLVREIQNQEQTQEVKLPDSFPDIGRVICAWGQVILRSKEWNSTGMNASGGVMVWVLYAHEEEAPVQCIETWVPFQMKWDLPETDREGTILLQPLLRSIDARTVSARKIMVRVNVSVMGEAVVSSETVCCQPPREHENVEMLRQTYPFRLYTQAGEKSFLLDEELSLPSSCPAADQVLRYDVMPILQEQKVMAGRVVFRGTANVHVLYRCENGNPAIWDFEIPFSQYADLDEETDSDAQAGIRMAVTSMELEQLDDRMFRLKCGLVGQYMISELKMVEIALDAYSPDRVVTTRMQTLSIPAVLEERQETMTAEATENEMQGMVLDVSFYPDFPRLSQNGDTVQAELPGIFQVLYQDREGRIQSAVLRSSENWQIPVDSGCVMHLVLSPNGRPQGSIGADLKVRAGAAMQYVSMADQEIPMMSGMEIGTPEKPDPQRPSLILRRSDGQDLWNLAKRCGTTMEAIRRANGLTTEPEAGQMLLIPVP